MAPVQFQDTPQRAVQVCSHCKNIKKGCDKKLPSCSQCIKRHAICRYGDTPEPRRYGDELVKAAQKPGVTRPVSPWASLPRPALGRMNPSIRLSILMINSMSDILYSDPLGSSGASSVDSIFHSQVGHILHASGQTVEGVVSAHFSGVHNWLPIISKKRFYDRFQYSRSLPTADFSILLLAMHLIEQRPSSNLEAEQDREVLYLATRTLFTQVQTFVPSSMCLVQTGVILARYEHGHGMIDAAYVTIGTSARLAFAIGIDNAQCSRELHGSDAWFDEEEALATWWGLVICDRNIICDTRMQGRPLSTRPIRDDDCIPLEPADLAGDVDFSKTPAQRYPVSAISLPSVGSFGKEAEAAYLLDKVLAVVASRETSDKAFITLGCELQMLLATVVDSSAGDAGSYCGATQIIIVGLYFLHGSAAMDLDITNRPEWIRITLSTITRMVIDLCYSFNKYTADFLDIAVMSPTLQHIARCAREHIITCVDLQDTQWQQDLEELRKILRHYNKRWTAAGMCFMNVSTFFADRLQPMNFGF
ncbi:hypothetical protein LSUE1_G005657 [Lachnellula suecica]|uniref:Zn(2)-C6 fungal-type domain-containing protein n=1 Tax=Lachnellula suecica TaxID=602035 RepID=A0A8T9C4T6_9HELO|nr:hypothetical protein LSUE1_G005657 [Lachnellula suecica]